VTATRSTLTVTSAAQHAPPSPEAQRNGGPQAVEIQYTGGMTYRDFCAACDSGTLSPSASQLLQSLYEDRRGDWDVAHSIAQTIHTPDGSLVHAYLHRKEGDLGNAGYWYSKAGAEAPEVELDAEWDALAKRFTE
jgi:hypothetical protein